MTSGGSYQDKMTLGEIGENDEEMFSHIVKNAKRYSFTNKKAAVLFAGACILKTVEKCGVKNPHKLGGRELDAAQKWHDIRIEHRDKYRMDDDWRNGFYLYKRDELIGFVSDVNGGRRLVYKALGKFAVEEPDRFWVVTNVKEA